ncbi:MAG: hypothetical protein LBG19_02345 [Prevotellaceae bacterium]|jgi:hypothetical protein|nr:hypothetical protein [Prevotellaceae bacterium]
MKKALRITLKSLSIFIVVVLLALFTLPFLFKGKLVQLAKNIINDNVEAVVDFQDVSVSLFKHFPNISLTLEDLRVVGVNEFSGDTLASLSSLNVSLNIWSYLKDDLLDINTVVINKPFIHAQVLADGKANWDIAKSDSAEVQEEVTAEEKSTDSNFKLALKKFEINNGTLIYEDNESATIAALENLNVRLSGDLTASETTLKLNTSANNILVISGGSKLVSKLSLDVRTAIDADLENGIYKISGGEFDINQMNFTADGQIAMVGEQSENMDIDLTYTLKVPSLATLINLIPKEYMKDITLEDTKGEFAMNGWVKGLYSQTSMPVIGLDLHVKDGYIKYSGLPESINKVAIDLNALLDMNADKNSKIDLSRLHFELAGNPFNASTTIHTPFTDANIKARFDGKINLASLNSALPLVDEMSLNGLMTANIDFAGLMSQIDNEQYEKLKLDGTLALTDFALKTPEFAQEIKIDKINLTFNPTKVALNAFDASIGKSDIHLTGSLENFLSYVFRNQTIRGQLNLASNLIDCNELMGGASEKTATEETVATPDETSTDVFVIPNNIDFTMKTNINRVVLGNLDMTNVGGNIVIKDGKLNLNNLVTNAMDGNMTVAGYYYAPDNTSATADMSLNIRKVEIKRLVESFAFINSLLPTAKDMSGKVSLGIAFNAPLDSNMELDINGLNAKGNLQTDSLILINAETLNKFTTLLKMGEKSNVLKDIDVNFTILNGRVQVPPFDVRLGNVKMKVGGEHGINDMNYHADVNIPMGKTGGKISSEISNVLSQAGINNVSPNLSVVPVGVAITGSMKSPKLALAKAKYGSADGETAPSLKDQVVSAVAEKVEDYKQLADSILQQKKDEAQQKIDEKKEELQQKAEEKKNEAAEKLKEKLKNKLPFKRP